MDISKIWESVWKSKAPKEVKAGFILSLLFSLSDRDGAKAIVANSVLDYEIGVNYIYAMDELEEAGYVEKVSEGYIIGRYTKTGLFKFNFSYKPVTDNYDAAYISNSIDRLLIDYKSAVGELVYLRYDTQINSKSSYFIREAEKDKLKPTYLVIFLSMFKSMSVGLRNINFNAVRKEIFVASHLTKSFSSHLHLLALAVYYVLNFKLFQSSYAKEINIYTFKMQIDKIQEHYERSRNEKTGSIRGA
jgi:hypothetical protein